MGKIQLNQKKISQYLTSTKEGGQEIKALGNGPRQTSLLQSMCSPRRAFLGAPRETGKATTSKPSPSTSGREGRVTLRRTKGENRGFGPLAKWLSAARPGTEEPRKDKEVRGNERGRTCGPCGEESERQV